ncbi:hypothetical protein [Orrella dioscoreae]|uniref:hypothetical protein n=1 Tax=Orrella dioscoreae TaxID=1851544 RepID=UPI000BF1EA63|nr:hypothetical protein [Orrella dioscoreae]
MSNPYTDAAASRDALMHAIVKAGQNSGIIRKDLESVSESQCLHILECLTQHSDDLTVAYLGGAQAERERQEQAAPSDDVVAWMTEDGRTCNAKSREGMHDITKASFCIPLARHGAQPAAGSREQIEAEQRARMAEKFAGRNGPATADFDLPAPNDEMAQPAASAEPLAVLRYERATPGRENEMPRVLSCNRLPDGEYRVYLSPVAAQARPTEKCGVLPPLPPYSDALLAKAPTAIEKFVADHEPAGDDDEPFRTQLEAALQQAFDLGLAAQASGQAQDAVAHQFSIEGVVHFKRSDPAEQVCVCCPQGGGHIFSRGVHWDAWETGYPEHFGNGANVLVMRHATDLNANEGKRVRLTVEVLDAARQESKGGEA